jgi:hypothetical protein
MSIQQPAQLTAFGIPRETWQAGRPAVTRGLHSSLIKFFFFYSHMTTVSNSVDGSAVRKAPAC